MKTTTNYRISQLASHLAVKIEKQLTVPVNSDYFRNCVSILGWFDKFVCVTMKVDELDELDAYDLSVMLREKLAENGNFPELCARLAKFEVCN